MTEENQFTIGALAKAAGVNVETVRYYQHRGLLAEPVKPPGSIRHYGADDLARLLFVRSAQRLGFSLDEVSQLLTLADGTHCSEAAEIAERHLADVRARLAELNRMESLLAKLVKQCKTQRSTVSCPLIESLFTAKPKA